VSTEILVHPGTQVTQGQILSTHPGRSALWQVLARHRDAGAHRPRRRV